MQIKNYLIYICCGLFTLLEITLLADSFINPETESFSNSVLKERLQHCNSILFFGGLGYVYFSIKNREKEYNTNKYKKYFLMFFASLIFILNSLFLILYPEEFRKGSKLLKLIIGYSGLIFFGLGLIASIALLLKKEKT